VIIFCSSQFSGDCVGEKISENGDRNLVWLIYDGKLGSVLFQYVMQFT